MARSYNIEIESSTYLFILVELSKNVASISNKKIQLSSLNNFEDNQHDVTVHEIQILISSPISLLALYLEAKNEAIYLSIEKCYPDTVSVKNKFTFVVDWSN